MKAKKKEAAGRDESLVFNTSKALTPNTSVARLLLAATRAMKEVLGPAIATRITVIVRKPGARPPDLKTEEAKDRAFRSRL